ncbi:MAG TPA: sigma factor-like helix-turn-helix DNA-binding protein [Bacillota bacterium]|nr:sigma factor-like helix-turn-helix DNA-binding protein [Bacillota bacterium]
MKIEIRGVENLSFRERQVVVLKEMGTASADIARRLGMTPSTVATLYNRAKSKGYEVVIVLPGTALGLAGAEEEEGGEV